MPAPSCLAAVVGTSWNGTSKLNLPWLPEDEQVKLCSSTLEVSQNTNHAIVSYTWEYESEPQTGTMQVAMEGDVANFSWTDSWHQSDGDMKLVGTCAGTQVSGLGSYGDEEHGVWGWRIDLIPSADRFVMKMTNIDPDGNEFWAVDAGYSRV